MDDGIDLNIPGFRQVLGQVALFSKRGAKAEFESAGRSVMNNVYAITPPAMGKGAKEKVSMFDAATIARGQSAIKRDVLGGKQRRGIFSPLADSLIDSALETGVYENESVRLFVKKNGDVYGTDRTHFQPDAGYDQLRAIHKANFRNGKMSSAGSYTRDIGRWKFINIYVVRQSSADSYLAEIYKHIGYLASCWNRAAKLVRARIPSYARGKNGPGNGELETEGSIFRFRFENLAPWADEVADGDLQRRLGYAVEYAKNAMARRLPHMIAAAAKEAGMHVTVSGAAPPPLAEAA